MRRSLQVIEINRVDLPNTEMGANGPLKEQPRTLDNILYVMSILKVDCIFNLMTYEPRIVSLDPAIIIDESEMDQRHAKLVILSSLMLCGIKCPDRTLNEVLFVRGRANEFHPVHEWITEVKWDGRGRFEDLAATVPVPEEHEQMWQGFLFKWSLQVIEATCGYMETGRGVMNFPYVLAFFGRQGVGKSQWVSQLMPREFTRVGAELHLNSYAAKDQQIAVLNHAIVELSELDGTFRKSDVEALKAFISRDVDEIRKAYRADASVRPRATCFIGTVNNRQFLVDQTGSRRYWPVEVTDAINWQHGIDMQQYWAQMMHEWREDPGFHMNEEEQLTLARYQQGFQQVSPAADILAEHFDTYHNDHGHYALFTLQGLLDFFNLGRAHPVRRDARRWLEDNLGQEQRLRGTLNNKMVRKNRVWAFPYGKEFEHELPRGAVRFPAEKVAEMGYEIDDE